MPKDILAHVTDMVDERSFGGILAMFSFLLANVADAAPLLLFRWGCAKGHPGPCDRHGG